MTTIPDAYTLTSDQTAAGPTSPRKGTEMRHKIGTVDREDVFIEIEYGTQPHKKPDKPELTISADIRRSGHCVAGGQSIDTVRRVATRGTLAPGWTYKRVLKLCRIWERWHLNGLRPGCEHQRAWGWDKLPINPNYPTDTYGKFYEDQHQDSWNMLTWVRRDEHPLGLLSHPCPSCGYKYGSAWLYEPLPQDVISFIGELIAA